MCPDLSRVDFRLGSVDRKQEWGRLHCGCQCPGTGRRGHTHWMEAASRFNQIYHVIVSCRIVIVRRLCVWERERVVETTVTDWHSWVRLPRFVPRCQLFCLHCCYTASQHCGKAKTRFYDSGFDLALRKGLGDRQGPQIGFGSYWFRAWTPARSPQLALSSITVWPAAIHLPSPCLRLLFCEVRMVIIPIS